MKTIKTISENSAHALDNAVATYTRWAQEEGIKVFATHTHVTWCTASGEGWFLYTAVLFIDIPDSPVVERLPVERGFCRVCGDDKDVDDLEQIEMDDTLDGPMKSGVCRTCEVDQ